MHKTIAVKSIINNISKHNHCGHATIKIQIKLGDQT